MPDDVVGLVRVDRKEDLEPERPAQQPDVVDVLVGRPVLADVEAEVRADDLHARLVDVVQPLLVVGLADAEDAERGEEA